MISLRSVKRTDVGISARRFSTLGFTLLFSIVVAASVSAATLPINEAKMDEIFGADNFGADSIDIRFLDELSIIDDSLFNITQAADFSNLIGLGDGLGLANNVVRMFFVESISWCSDNGSFAGCGGSGTNFRHANDVMVEIGVSGRFAPLLQAHELGHNLGLSHVATANNLMRRSIGSNNVELTQDQVDVVLRVPTSTSIIAFDGSQRYIEIAPILVSASAVIVPQPVPVPGALLLCASGLGALGLRRRRQSST